MSIHLTGEVLQIELLEPLHMSWDTHPVDNKPEMNTRLALIIMRAALCTQMEFGYMIPYPTSRGSNHERFVDLEKL